MDPVVSILARVLVALLFARSVRPKLADRLRFEGVVTDHRLAPAGWSRALALGAIGIEAVLVPLVLLPATTRAAAATAAILLVAYSAAIALNLARGRDEIECGCGGEGETLHPWLLARNALLVGVCLAAAAPVAERALGLVDALTIAMAAAALGLLGMAAARLARVAAAARGAGAVR